ncbi:hypothetical protein MTO96_034011 [Rhipicephalus appendiculatus]
MDLTLITDKAFPDSNRQLTTYYVLETRFDVARSKTREFTVTDWDHFRKLRSIESAPAPRCLEDWREGIKSDMVSSTKKIATDLEVDMMDSRLSPSD